jgi:hypothetical protein
MEYACISLKLLNYLKTEFKMHKKNPYKIIPGVVVAERVASIRGDPCGTLCYVTRFG